jgi:hypothetical protein
MSRLCPITLIKFANTSLNALFGVPIEWFNEVIIPSLHSQYMLAVTLSSQNKANGVTQQLYHRIFSKCNDQSMWSEPGDAAKKVVTYMEEKIIVNICPWVSILGFRL